jgi:Tfp pilus assembly protein PilE
MGRGLSLVLLLVPLVMGGYLLNAQMNGGSSGQSAIQQIDKARRAALDARFQQAAVQLEQFRASNGTYAGATADGFVVARADAESYCIETATQHLAGPGGSPASGPC